MRLLNKIFSMLPNGSADNASASSLDEKRLLAYIHNKGLDELNVADVIRENIEKKILLF